MEIPGEKLPLLDPQKEGLPINEKNETEPIDGEPAGDGWIKLHRKSIHSRVFQSEGLWKLWTWCLMRANHEDAWIPITTGKGTTEVFVKRGQFIFGRKTAAKALKMPGRTVYDRMLKLESMRNLATIPASHYSVVTILNYDTYQGGKHDVPTPNQHPTNTNKNVKKLKNKRIYVEDSTELRLASFLLNEIQKRRERLGLSLPKKPSLQTWAYHIELLIKKDGRTEDQIRKVILWTQNDNFWGKNIRSTEKLKKKFEQLEECMASEKNGPKEKIRDLTGTGRW